MQYISTLGLLQAYSLRIAKPYSSHSQFSKNVHDIHVIIFKRSSESKKKKMMKLNRLRIQQYLLTTYQLTSNVETKIHTVMTFHKHCGERSHVLKILHFATYLLRPISHLRSTDKLTLKRSNRLIKHNLIHVCVSPSNRMGTIATIEQRHMRK